MDSVKIGGKSAQQLGEAIKQIEKTEDKNVKDMLDSRDFTTLEYPDTLRMVRLKVRDLGFGFSNWATTDDIYERAQELGLNLCPAEVGHHLRLKNQQDQSSNNWYNRYFIGMKPIANSDGQPRIFQLNQFNGRLWLASKSTFPNTLWHTVDDEFVFCLRKQT